MTTIAERNAKDHKSISVAEFFERNKHLLGFENDQKSLLTCVREAVDNALDACEDARILPSIYLELKQLDQNNFKLIIEDNGPGIVKKNIPNIFAKLLYGSKFNLKQSRGQQGIGISASVLYSQLTTGKPTKIYSKIGDGKTHIYELNINIKKNEPDIISEMTVEGDGHGTRIEMCIKGKYIRGKQSVEEYLMETAIMNPFASIVYINPEGKQFEYPRAIDILPKEAESIRPHPHGLELGVLMRLMKHTESKNLTGFFTTELSRVGRGNAVDICNRAGINPKTRPKRLSRDEIEKLLNALNTAKIAKPSTDCLSPVGEDAIKKGLKKEMNPEFIAVMSRPPTVYKGYPFQIEVGIGYGGDLSAEGPIAIMRFANKVPLLYQQSSCVIVKSVIKLGWKRYGLKQSNGSIPLGPIALTVHMASVWVPYTSEGKEAIAAYPEILKEVTLALQGAARKLGIYISKKRKSKEAEDRLRAFDIYAGELCVALSELTGEESQKIQTSLKQVVAEKVGDTKIVLHGKGMEIQNDDNDDGTDTATKPVSLNTENDNDADTRESGQTQPNTAMNENPQSRLDIFNNNKTKKATDTEETTE
ncbi:MAG: DNA topoisomerase VI subunit B [Nanohaloarchaea archaeon]|nr:DNA topoisomerase VI subunit B [Candidatus Nanohaloarchaea archaeon]